MSDNPDGPVEAGTPEAVAELDALRSAAEEAKRRSGAARSWTVMLMNDLAWMIGAASQAGIEVPSHISEDLQEAVSWIASE